MATKKGGQEMNHKALAMLILSLSLISGAVLTGGCTQQAEAPIQIIKDFSAQEAFNLIQENRGNTDFIIIDVRTPEEFTDGHIENAINIDFNSQMFESEISKLNRDKTYLIYCRSGNRSRAALDTMVKLEFTKVYHLMTGIIGWLEEDFPITK